MKISRIILLFAFLINSQNIQLKATCGCCIRICPKFQIARKLRSLEKIEKKINQLLTAKKPDDTAILRQVLAAHEIAEHPLFTNNSAIKERVAKLRTDTAKTLTATAELVLSLEKIEKNINKLMAAKEPVATEILLQVDAAHTIAEDPLFTNNSPIKERVAKLRANTIALIQPNEQS